MLLGVVVGGIAGYAGGALDEVLMRASDFVMVLPAIYVALALRSVLPLVLGAGTGLRAARGHLRGRRRAVHRARRSRRSSAPSGGSTTPRRRRRSARAVARLLVRHLLPAARGFIVVQITLLVPAFIVAEATLSFVGLGFPDPVASWGTMLHDASRTSACSPTFRGC